MKKRTYIAGVLAISLCITACGKTPLGGGDSEAQTTTEVTTALLESTESTETTEEGTGVGRVIATAIGEMPEGNFQARVSFPDWYGEIDTSLAMNSMYSFDGWEDQGELYIRIAPEVTRAEVFINGTKVEWDSWQAGNVYKVDYSAAAVNGRNTIQVSEIQTTGAEADGAETADTEDAEGTEGPVTVAIPYPTVIEGSLEDVGINPESVQLISDLIASDVEYGFPSAQLAVVKDGKLVCNRAFGSTNAYLPDGSVNPDAAPATTETLYDLASVTKMASVNYALQKLVTDGRIGLDDTVASYLGERFYENTLDFEYVGGDNPGIETQKAWKSSLTLRDLLCHQGGFPADPRYCNIHVDAASQKYDKNAENLLYAGCDGTPETKAATIEAICKTPLLYKPGSKTVYSDVDYMILGAVIEQVVGTDLDTYMKQTFYQPMGLNHITYNPLQHGFTKEDCAATELNGNTRDGAVTFPGIRTETLQGQVHDEKAFYSMGGVSGHAGLFANAADLATLGSVMLTGGYGNQKFFSDNVMDTFTSPKASDAANWGLGWWREAENQRVWYFGTQADTNTIGHQGWTGCLLMIDPEENLVVAYLTNKINSPVTNPSANSNRFDGNWYTASTLGFVPQILYLGTHGEAVTPEQRLALLSDMAGDSITMARDGGVLGTGHPLVKNAESKIALYKQYAEAYGSEEALQHAEELASMLQKN